MKKFLMMAAVLLSSVGAFAQREVGSWNVQPKVGLNLTTVTEDNAKSHFTYVAGAELEYQATDLLSLSAGLLYSQQGYKLDTGVSFAGLSIDDHWTPAYLNIPLMANVYVTKGLAVKLGVQPGILVSKDEQEGRHSDTESFDFSIPVGLSYEFNNWQIDGRYNWGLTKISKNSDAKNSVIQLTVGYKFDL